MERQSQPKIVPPWIHFWGLSYGLGKDAVIYQNSHPWQSSIGPQAFSILMINATNQLDRMQNHSADKHWGMTIVREFLPWAEVRGPFLNEGGTKPQVGDLG